MSITDNQKIHRRLAALAAISTSQVTEARNDLARKWANGFKVGSNALADYAAMEARYNVLVRAAALVEGGMPVDEITEIALGAAMDTGTSGFAFGDSFALYERRAWREVYEIAAAR